MARQGKLFTEKQIGRPNKAISSGRLISSGRGPAGKRKVFGRQDPGYSLYSTDSEDQVTTVHKGLDRCAALLNGILQIEKTDAKPACSKPGKSAPAKSKLKLMSGKSENEKKRHVKKIGSVPQSYRTAAIQKTVLSSKSFPGMREQQCFHEVPKPVVQPTEASGSRIPPEVMPSWQRGLLDAQVPEGGSIHPLEPQNSTVFNCRLTTSTPTLSPQKSNNPTYSEPCVCSHGFPDGEGYCCVQHACLPTAVPLSQHASLTPSTSMEIPAQRGLQSQHSLRPGALQSAGEAPAPIQVARAHPLPGAGNRAATSGESSEYSDGSAIEEDEVDCVDVTPVRESSCQTSFEKRLCTKARKMSPVKTDRKVATLKCLVGELKARFAAEADCEALRLILEVEQSIALLPAVVGSANVQAEITLAVQPLRCENAQLRRRIRILNQQLMERERAVREARPPDCDFEMISLQSANVSLQSQLQETRRDVQAMQQENGQLRQAVEDKDRELLQSRQQCQLDISCIKMEVDKALSEMKSCQFKLETSEKENDILVLSLQKREAEISRLQEENRRLHGTAPGVSPLRSDTEGAKPTTSLTKTVLDLFEDEQEELSPSDPVSNPIKKYLETLEEGKFPTPQTVPQTAWDERGIGQLSPKCTPVRTADEGRFSLNEGLELGKTAFVPLKKSAQIQPWGSALKSSGKIETGQKGQSEGPYYVLEGLNLSQGRPGHSALSPKAHREIADPSKSKSGKSTVPSNGHQCTIPLKERRVKTFREDGSVLDSTTLSCETMVSNWSAGSCSTFNTQDEINFRNGLAALDASIASLQKTIQSDLKRSVSDSQHQIK